MSSSTQELHTATTELLSHAAVTTGWLALAVSLTDAFLPILDFTIVNLSLPSIRQSLGATSAQVQFVISAYAATYAVMLITGGRLGDLLGRKRPIPRFYPVASWPLGFQGQSCRTEHTGTQSSVRIVLFVSAKYETLVPALSACTLLQLPQGRHDR
jgi:MFS family permease